jgi:hypothetical protein
VKTTIKSGEPRISSVQRPAVETYRVTAFFTRSIELHEKSAAGLRSSTLMPPPQLVAPEILEFPVFQRCRSDAVDNLPQVMLKALVVIKLKAKASGFAVARDRSKCGVDIVPSKSNPHVAKRDRQPR